MRSFVQTVRKRWVNDPRFLHGVGVALWGLLLAGAGQISRPAELPWLLLYGLVPAVVGYGVFVLWPKGGPAAEVALLTGERLGIALGAGALSEGPIPLLLCALWPEVWAARHPSLGKRGIALLAMLALYLAVGIYHAPHHALRQLLSALLYGIVLAFTPGWLARGSATMAPKREAACEDNPMQTAEPPPAVRPEMAPVGVSTDQESLLQDLRVARDIQVSLLLASSPRLPGWETSTSFLPAREIGGDLYDFLELDERRRGIMIGDVSGKGIPAALHMAVARTLFRVEARQQSSPGQTLARVNRALMEQAPRSCVSLLYLALDISDGHLVVANAGHHYPILLDQEAHEIEIDGLPLGIDRDYVYEEKTARLAPGDVLVLYTDGVVEALNDHSEPFGFERLRDLLTASPVRRPRSLVRQIVRAVRVFSSHSPQSDDITVLVLRRRYADRLREMREVATDVLGPEGGVTVEALLRERDLPPDAPQEAWQRAVLDVGNRVREQWGQGLSRELVQQMLMALEGFTP